MSFHTLIRVGLLVLVWLSHSSFAFIPPVPAMLKEIFEARKPGQVFEARLKHRIESRPGEVFEMEERILRDHNETLFLWRQVGQPTIVAGRLDGQNYFLGKDKAIPTASLILVNYLVSDSADSFRDLLLGEQFVRRDELYQFKPGFTATGDPQTWNLAENYFKHEDISLFRLPSGIAIAVQGMNEGANQRTIFFDRGLRGIASLQWKQSEQTAQWDCEQFQGKASDGFYPRKLTFQRNGVTMVQSELSGVKRINGKLVSDFRTTWKQAARVYAANAPFETALRTLLSYR